MFFLWRRQTTIDGLFRDDILPDRNGHELVDYWRGLLPQMEHTDELGGFQLLEIRSSLPDELLMYADKLSMAHSLEVRVPYLDRTVVEYVQRLGAQSSKSAMELANGCTGGSAKVTCRHVSSSERNAVLPRMWWTNGFVRRSTGELPELLLDESSLMFGLLKPEAGAKTPRTIIESGRQDNHKLLFSLVMLEQWLRREWLVPAPQEMPSRSVGILSNAMTTCANAKLEEIRVSW